MTQFTTDQAYAERNFLVTQLARLAAVFYDVYYIDTGSTDGFKYLLVIDTGEHQMSWHFKDSELWMLQHFECKDKSLYTWDGHGKKEVEARVAMLVSDYMGLLPYLEEDKQEAIAEYNEAKRLAGVNSAGANLLLGHIDERQEIVELIEERLPE